MTYKRKLMMNDRVEWENLNPFLKVRKIMEFSKFFDGFFGICYSLIS